MFFSVANLADFATVSVREAGLELLVNGHLKTPFRFFLDSFVSQKLCFLYALIGRRNEVVVLARITVFE